MTIRQDMLAATARAKHLLNESAADVIAFTQGQMNADGGFKGRGDASDLYYTLFAVETLLALGARFEKKSVLTYLQQFEDGRSLDLVHLACLVRCRADIGEADTASLRGAIAQRLETYRCADGGYANAAGAAHGTAYGCFLALGAFQDLQLNLQNAAGLLACIRSLQRLDGAYANDATAEAGSTPATAAAVVTLLHLGQPSAPASLQWLLARNRATGGFLATPTAPIPDLLSTATAVHALAATGAALETVRRPTLEFIDSVWSTEGAFAGNWLDETLDCEYTFYALLALGHLTENQ